MKNGAKTCSHAMNAGSQFGADDFCRLVFCRKCADRWIGEQEEEAGLR